MEERIITDEYGRGIKLKKTKDGYIDATDELAEETLETQDGETAEGVEEGSEEVLFEFPVLEEDDEELATLTVEEAQELQRKREEERLRIQAEYQTAVEKGNELLDAGEFEKAEDFFDSVMNTVEENAEAVKGFILARTKNFTEPDALPEYYREFGRNAYNEFFSDAGENTVCEIKERFGEVFRNKLEELEREETPLKAEVEEKQAERRAVLSARKKAHLAGFIAATVPTLIFLIATIFFGVQINTRPDKLYVYVTIGFAAALGIVMIFFVAAANKFLNTMRFIRENESLFSTEEGIRLVEIRRKKRFYENLVK